MHWLDFTQLVEIPAFLGLVAAINWIYSELKGEIKRIQSQHGAMLERIALQRESDRLQHQEWLIDVIKHYVPKEDVVRLEERILEAISRLESKIDRQRLNSSE
jgi:hypothetical protein